MFAFSKLFWELARPSTFLLLLALVGCLLLWNRGWSRGWRTGRIVILTALALLVLPSLVPLAPLLAAPLENAYAPAELPQNITGILVLGGAEMPKTSVARGQLALGAGGERLLLALELAQRYPDATLAFSGVTGTVYGGGTPAQDVTRELFRAFGIAQDRLVVEVRSRNTLENIRFSQALLEPRPGDAWVVVTSAMHMPRTLGLFEKASWPVLPYPVDYTTAGRAAFAPTLRFAENLDKLDTVVREWVGLVSYRLLGRTDALFPRDPASGLTFSSR